MHGRETFFKATDIVVAISDSEVSAKAAADSFTEIWGGLMPFLEGAPETREFAKAHVVK